MTDKKFAKILVNLPVDGPFDYAIPLPMALKIQKGSRVKVSFGPRNLIGYVVGFSKVTSIKDPKKINELIDSEAIIDDEMLAFTKRISDRYMCSWGEALEAAIPSSLKKGKTQMKARNKSQIPLPKKSENFIATNQQKRCLGKILKASEIKKTNVFLLHGITGSGKTEIYLQTIEKMLKQDKSCIVLVPEISLTPQATERFKSRFQENVAVLHSRLTHGEKFEEWKKIKQGKCRIVVGARSAIFAPVKNLGLIVVDEEHDTSYKQQDAPRYHAVEAAIMRADISNALVILGSATPSLESYYKAKNKKYILLELKQRIENRPLPKTRIIDMRDEIANRKKRYIVFSYVLSDAIQKALQKNEQVILFLNRRGFSTYANCKKCGFVFRCKKCNIALNYHSDKNKLICHYCNYQIEPKEICPECGSSYISYFGFGTQKVESELSRLFPTAKTIRMDTDSTKKAQSHKDMLEGFASGKYNILVGTQMITKGHDFPQVTLVGVVSADTALNLPDFRAGERTFQLITQVAGRAGRGYIPGEVVIQTYAPHHYAIISALGHDYKDFYEKEIALRKELMLPPFSDMITVTFRSYSEEKSEKRALELFNKLNKAKIKECVEITGPVPDMMYRLRRQYRWNVIIKIKDAENIPAELITLLRDFKSTASVKAAIDLDR